MLSIFSFQCSFLRRSLRSKVYELFLLSSMEWNRKIRSGMLLLEILLSFPYVLNYFGSLMSTAMTVEEQNDASFQAYQNQRGVLINPCVLL